MTLLPKGNKPERLRNQVAKNQILEKRKHRSFKLHRTTFILVSIVILCGIIVAAWFAGENKISGIFAELNYIQKNPPIWLEVPMVTGKYLLAPTVALLVSAIAIMKVSPEPKVWSRRLVVGILLTLSIRYIFW
ncbi:MAG: cellulose synthase catalytic subunit, partial [Cyanobacteria bacterium P01_A01_bin.45]